MFGFINCIKPSGMTSRDLVNIAARRVRPHKVGHSGTLDPLAEGVLVLGVGRASRLTSFVQNYPKQYLASFRLGAESESGDLEQPLTEHPDDPVPTLESLVAGAKSLTGEVVQVPSAYSAIWIDGKRACDRIRNGEQVDVPSRKVQVYDFKVLKYDYPNIQLDITCGSGTYVRSLGVDLAASVRAHAVMTHLVRTRIGPFAMADAISIEQIRHDDLEAFVQPARLGVEHLPHLSVNDEDAMRLINGLNVFGTAFYTPIDPLTGDAGPIESSDPTDEGIAAAIRTDGRLIAIVRGKTKQYDPSWYPERVFPLKPRSVS
ncbi:tRNA pseudouridine(55) synthase TruB [Novipirellula caenicola]